MISNHEFIQFRKPVMPGSCRANLMLALIMLAWLTACAHSDHYAPVGYAGKLTGSHYLVQKGDTLYSIAFRFGLDYKSVARANHIKPPYIIFTNQKIKIAGIQADDQPDSKPAPSRLTNSKNVAKRSLPSPGIPKTSFSNKTRLVWIWPMQGEVVRTFALQGDINKGIDISGNTGQSVVSAEDGVVVYAGGSLRGYGKLVIVKHNDSFLSAYGNNDKLNVKEGQKVRAGDRLARIGGVNKEKPFLHFEIRRNGKPQNPLAHLPKIKKPRNKKSKNQVAHGG